MDFHEVEMMGPLYVENINDVVFPEAEIPGRLLFWISTISLYFSRYEEGGGYGWQGFLDGEDTIDADSLNGHSLPYFAIDGHAHNYAPIDHTHTDIFSYSEYLQKTNNLSDVADKKSSREHLGINVGNYGGGLSAVFGNEIWLQTL